jgi:hypothetical protein
MTRGSDQDFGDDGEDGSDCSDWSGGPGGPGGPGVYLRVLPPTPPLVTEGTGPRVGSRHGEFFFLSGGISEHRRATHQYFLQL